MILNNIRRIYSLDQSIFRNTLSTVSSLNSAILSTSKKFSDKPTHIIQMRGLDFDTKEKDIIEPLGIVPKVVHLKCDGSGRVSGVSEVEFATHAEAVVAMRKKNAFIGNRFVRLALKSSEINTDQFKKSDIAKHLNQPTSKEFVSGVRIDGSYLPTAHMVEMKNAPRRMTPQAIYEFFWPVGATPIKVDAKYNESGVRTGEFDVYFLTKTHAQRAMAKNNAYIGKNFVELYLSKR